MIIRLMQPQDRPALIAMGLNFARNTPAFATVLAKISAESVGYMLDLITGLGPDKAAIFVAVDEQAAGLWNRGEVIGCFPIAAVPNLLTGEIIAEELTWFVDPSRRGMRAGPRLLTAATDWAMARGLKMLKMGAPAGSDVGRFYEHQGFQAVETAYYKVL